MSNNLYGDGSMSELLAAREGSYQHVRDCLSAFQCNIILPNKCFSCRDAESCRPDTIDKPCNELGDDSSSAVGLSLTASPKVVEEASVAEEKCSTVIRNAVCCWVNAPQTRSLVTNGVKHSE